MRPASRRPRFPSRRWWLLAAAPLLIAPIAGGAARAAEPPPRPGDLKTCLEKKSCTAEQVQAVLDAGLRGTRARASVIALAGNRFAITLEGQAGSAAEKEGLEKWVAGLSADFQVLATIAVDRSGKKTDFWFQTFWGQSLGSTAAGKDGKTGQGDGPEGDGGDDPLVAALQAIYGPNAIRRAGGNRLLLTGDDRELAEMRHFLALIDTPLPQVQLNLWAVQISGSQPCIAERTAAIRHRIRATRDRILEVRELLRKQVRKPPRAALPVPCRCIEDRLERHLCHAGLDLDPRGNLSLNEALIFLILDPEREAKVERFRGEVAARREEWAGQDAAGPETPACGAGGSSRKPAKGAAPPARPLFPRLLAQLADDRQAVDRYDFEQFGNALACFKDGARAAERPDAPRRLAQTGATIDGRLKAVMDAFSEDMGELFFEPLLAGIQGMAAPRSGRGDPGVTLVGQSRLVVTSARKSALSSEMAAFVESTRPKPFDKSLLDSAFPAARGADRSALSGAAGVLSGLPQAQALLLTAALASETEPTFTKVAPGISIDARPTVFPDGGTARLLIEARFSNGTTVDTTTDGNWAGPPPDSISSHTATTDAAVNPFDLLELSSFDQESSAPRSPFYVPILGRLPILGRAFQIPRPPKKTHFESLLLVNSVILPRAVELQRFYSRRTDPDFPIEALVCRDPGTDVDEEMRRAEELTDRKGCDKYQAIARELDRGLEAGGPPH